MARWYVRRRGRFFRYGRFRGVGRRYRRRYSSYSRRYVNGSSRSQVRLKVPVTFTPSFPSVTASGAVTVAIQPFYDAITTAAATSNAARSALMSPLYRQYCSLYEEVKCVGMKVKLAVTSNVGTSDIPSLQIYTAFDRRGSWNEQSGLPTFADIKNYATFSAATAVNNSVAKLERSIYASDIMERAQWHDCTLTSIPSTSNSYRDAAYYQADSNVNFFAPTMYINVAIPQGTVSQTVNTVCEVMYYFAFRNPKFGASSGASSKFTSDPIDFQSRPSMDDDGRMDDGIPPLPDDDPSDFPDVTPAVLTRRARSNASADLQAEAAPSTRRARSSKNVK